MKSIFPFLTAFLLLSVTCALQAKGLNFEGIAYKSKDKKDIVYIEKHRREFVDSKVTTSETIYYDTSGKKIATLKCDYVSAPFLPEFEFTDHRTGYSERVVKKDKLLRIEYKDSSEAKLEVKELEINDSMSASQGLNELIKFNLAKLHKNDDLSTSFLLPSRLGDIGMLITGKAKDADRVSVIIKVKNIFLRIFAPQLEMLYSKETGHLLHYFGNSNIMTAKGGKQTVYIEYNYDPGSKVALNE